MAKFIEVHDKIINIKNISKVNFISDDIYLGLFPRNKEGEIDIDYIPFTFAQIELFTGEKLDLEFDLFQPGEDENEAGWAQRNRAYINMSWAALKEALGEITEVTNFEYKYL